jgi:hypothetical protein
MRAVAIDEDTAVLAHFLRVPAAEVGVEEGAGHTPQRLHRGFVEDVANFQHDAPLLLLLVFVHCFDFFS